MTYWSQTVSTSKLTQLDNFKEAARELETDDYESRVDERVKKLVKPAANIAQKSGRIGG